MQKLKSNSYGKNYLHGSNRGFTSLQSSIYCRLTATEQFGNTGNGALDQEDFSVIELFQNNHSFVYGEMRGNTISIQLGQNLIDVAGNAVYKYFTGIFCSLSVGWDHSSDFQSQFANLRTNRCVHIDAKHTQQLIIILYEI